MTHLGVISDTHGYWNPSLPEQFAGVNHILHAGDIGSQIIIDRLEQLAPTTAVLGNTDVGLVFPETASLTIEGYRILIHHIVTVGPSYQPIPQAPDPSKPDLIVFGHTHRPYSQSIDGVLYLNPGYAGRHRAGQPRSIGRLGIDPQRGLSWETIPLDTG